MSTVDLDRTEPTIAAWAVKVPEVTVYFWIIKVLTTGMGETLSDFLARTIDPFVAVGVGGVGFAAALILQFSTRRYVTWVYWLAVVMVSVFGTMAADAVHVEFGVSYAASSVVFAVVLASLFAVWYRREKTLPIHSIDRRRREVFYWLTVVTTFALGTAAGDVTASTMRLGYFSSAVLFAVVIAVPAVAWRMGMNAVVTFWFAYIVTRPLGASVADWMAVPHTAGGLGLGTGTVTVIWTVAIVAFVAYLATTRRDAANQSVS